MQAVRADIAEIQKKRGVTVSESLVNADLPATCSPAIVAALEGFCQEQGILYRKMVSRAYHDTLFMASVTPVTMIFIPCRGGVSHRPDEFSTSADIARGALLLAQVLAKVGSE
jgi:N-carbamoyl-L-amino-acid hydrolase